MIASLAGRQHGIVPRSQLLAAGMTGAAIDGRVKRRRLWRVHQGIGGASQEAAAAVLGLIPSMPAVIDVSVTGRAPRNRPTVRFHERQNLDWTTISGLRVTTPFQTLKDLGFPDRARRRDAERDAALGRERVAVIRFGAEVKRAPMKVVATLAGRLSPSGR